MTYEMKIREERKYAYQEGKAEEKAETAIGMLYDNMPIRSIAKYTKLSLDYIRELAAKHNLTVVE